MQPRLSTDMAQARRSSRLAGRFPERLDVLPQGGEVQLAAVLELGDVALGDLQLVGELYLEVQ